MSIIPFFKNLKNFLRVQKIYKVIWKLRFKKNFLINFRKNNLHTVRCITESIHSVSFESCICPQLITTNKIQNISIIPERFLLPLYTPSLPDSLAYTTDHPFVCRLACILYKWNLTLHTSFMSDFFHSDFEIHHVVVYISHFFLLLSSMSLVLFNSFTC